MVIASIVLLLAGAVIVLGHFFARHRTETLRSGIALGAAIGLVRGCLASAGWYVVERSGGPVQIPAYALSMLAWPEGMLLGPSRTLRPMSFYVQLALLLTVTTAIMVGALAALVRVRHPTS